MTWRERAACRGKTTDRWFPETIFGDADRTNVPSDVAAILFLAGHGTAFGTATQLPRALEATLAKAGAEMRARLLRLNEQNVTAAIGDLVGSRSVKALLQRRYLILGLAAGPAGR